MCNITENNNLSYYKDMRPINKYFKKSTSEYAENILKNNPISAYYINVISNDNGSGMLFDCIYYNKASYFSINPIEAEYGDDEEKHNIYSTGICMKYYNKPLDVIFSFIVTSKGEGHLFTNDSLYGCDMMISLVFGGQDKFKSSSQIKSAGVNDNQGQLIPFINMIEQFINAD